MVYPFGHTCQSAHRPSSSSMPPKRIYAPTPREAEAMAMAMGAPVRLAVEAATRAATRAADERERKEAKAAPRGSTWQAGPNKENVDPRQP